MPDITSVQASAVLGSLYKPEKKPRDHYSHEMTETCSLTDRVYQDTSSLLKIVEIDEESGTGDYLYSNRRTVRKKDAPEDVIENYEDMIEEHVERRVLFFFQQLIAVYKTKLHFESVGASDQAKSAVAVTVKIKGKIREVTKRQAAHSSTNPRLIAYDNTAWKDYQKGRIEKPKGFVFLEGTDYYRTQNATTNMSKWVNDADREIDEKTSLSELREKSTALLNKASQGKLTPDEGIIEFCKEALVEVRDAKGRLQKKNEQKAVQKVLSIYKKNLQKIEQQIRDDSVFLGNFLNVKLKNSSDTEATAIQLNIRYAAIRNANIKQSELIQKVEKVKLKILSAVEGSQKPTYFDQAFRATLIKQVSDEEDRQRLEKLYNFSPDHFVAQKDTDKGAITKYKNTKKLLVSHLKDIKRIGKEVVRDMDTLRDEEINQRAEIAKDLREMKGWSKEKLDKKMTKLFSDKVPTTKHIESGKKEVTPKIAKKLSRIFDVDPGLFMPQFFYD